MRRRRGGCRRALPRADALANTEGHPKHRRRAVKVRHFPVALGCPRARLWRWQQWRTDRRVKVAIRHHSAAKPLPAIEDLLDRFRYDPETGVITHAKDGYRSNVRAGDIAGTRVGPRLKLCIGRKHVMAHRVAWKLHYGCEPPAIIDHVNGNPFDNRICNLREADTVSNGQNQNRQMRNRTGVTGVTICKQTGMYRAVISGGRKTHCLGRYKTLAEATAARAAAESETFGAFAAGNREARAQ